MEIQRLRRQHQGTDLELLLLIGRPHLTPAELAEVQALKKRKLQLKDRMEDILRRHRGQHAHG